MRSDENSEDPKQPKPVKNRKKDSNRFERMEADGRSKLLGSEDLDRHQHV